MTRLPVPFPARPLRLIGLAAAWFALPGCTLWLWPQLFEEQAIPKGQIQGTATDSEGNPIPYAEVKVPGAARQRRAGADGRFTVADMLPGPWVLLLTEDNNRDGWPDRSRVLPTRVTEGALATSPLSLVTGPTGEPVVSGVELGDVELSPTVALAGTVDLTAAGPTWADDYVARVVVSRSQLLPLTDGAVDSELDLGAVAVTSVDQEGDWRVEGAGTGTLYVTAVLHSKQADSSVGAVVGVSESVKVDAQPTTETNVELTVDALTLEPQGAVPTQDVVVLITPAPPAEVYVIFSPPGLPRPPCEETYPPVDTFQANFPDAVLGDLREPSTVQQLTAPQGSWDVLVCSGGLTGVLYDQLIRPSDDVLTLGPAALGAVDNECVGWEDLGDTCTDDSECSVTCDEGDDSVRCRVAPTCRLVGRTFLGAPEQHCHAARLDCDGDALEALPLLSTLDPGDVTSCAATCGGLVGSELEGATCSIAGTTYDCDDDGDGQADATEGPCYGPGLGTDLDQDGLCSTVDAFPQCAANNAEDCQAGTNDVNVGGSAPVRDDGGTGGGDGGQVTEALQVFDPEFGEGGIVRLVEAGAVQVGAVTSIDTVVGRRIAVAGGRPVFAGGDLQLMVWLFDDAGQLRSQLPTPLSTTNFDLVPVDLAFVPAGGGGPARLFVAATEVNPQAATTGADGVLFVLEVTAAGELTQIDVTPGLSRAYVSAHFGGASVVDHAGVSGLAVAEPSPDQYEVYVTGFRDSLASRHHFVWKVLDNAWADAGTADIMVTEPDPAAGSVVDVVWSEPADRLLVAGLAPEGGVLGQSPQATVWALSRATGLLDATFGASGSTQLLASGEHDVRALSLDDEVGRVVLAGSVLAEGLQTPALGGVTTDGQPTFGDTGTSVWHPLNRVGEVRGTDLLEGSVAGGVATGQGYLLVGDSWAPGRPEDPEMTLWLLDDNAEPDETLFPGGVFIDDDDQASAGDRDRGVGLVLAEPGAAVIAGVSLDADEGDLVLWKARDPNATAPGDGGTTIGEGCAAPGAPSCLGQLDCGEDQAACNADTGACECFPSECAGGLVYTLDLPLSSVADWQASYQDATCFIGDVVLVQNPGLASTLSAPNLAYISGTLGVAAVPGLQQLSFPSLVRVPGGIAIQNNPDLTAIPMDSLVSTNGVFFVSGNDVLVDLLLSNLVGAVGGVIIQDNPTLELADFPLLSNSLATLIIERNLGLTSVNLGALSQVGGPLLIRENPLLETATGLQDLTDVGGELSVKHNWSLLGLSFDQLAQVGGDLELSGIPEVSTLAFPNLTTVAGALVLRDLPLLCMETLVATSFPSLTSSARVEHVLVGCACGVGQCPTSEFAGGDIQSMTCATNQDVCIPLAATECVAGECHFSAADTYSCVPGVGINPAGPTTCTLPTECVGGEVPWLAPGTGDCWCVSPCDLGVAALLP